MKILVILLLAFTFMACSSVKKQPDATPTQAAQTTPKADTTKNSAKVDADIVKKEACESGDDKRIIEVHKKSSGCELSYTKFGQEKVVASGKYGLKHCEDTLDKITKKLEAQSFKCDEG